jgi:N-acetylglucosaminyldiphosphoundecaprenol N-acetyl-beta-D-mannosaminyltransferase
LNSNSIPPLTRVNILGIGVSAIHMNLALAQIGEWVARRERQYVCITNVHVIMESRRSPDLRRALNRAGMVTPDGMPLVWLSRLRGFSQVQRVYGPDLLLEACQRSLATGWGHYFYGGGPGVAETLAVRLSKRFPGLKLCGCESPPFRPLTEAEDQSDVERINASGADLLWVGLGAPKQELWMASHLGRVTVPVMLGVGAAFDFHAGLKSQAPRWLQRAGLEWLFRLASEPRRLWRRYLVNNPAFLLLAALQLAGLKKYPLD